MCPGKTRHPTLKQGNSDVKTQFDLDLQFQPDQGQG